MDDDLAISDYSDDVMSIPEANSGEKNLVEIRSKTSRINQVYDGVHENNPSDPLSAKLDSFRSWEAGWDGDDAEAPSNVAIDSAQIFADMLPPDQRRPSAMVLNYGTVAVFWRNKDGRYLEVGFNSRGRLYWYAKVSENNKFYGDDASVHNFEVVENLIGLVDQVTI
jgi:hypothetical protein